ncbi:hypothetical protein BVG19_g1038 [[Candida] boidinii]|nr:hypothetical protein BVG19_g1038 [[Candida] boidinii]OWB50647.1 hypothetical protein B5S27_g2199 [[Candida] boidinii]
MATKQSQKRLTKEYKSIESNPPPYIIAKPSESNILEWHYIITGPPETPYAGGQYHGILTFPSDYPFKPPSIRMVTPNGRFQVNTRLCLSMSDYHPDTWNPSWSVSTILIGLLSFMTGEESTTGSISTSDVTKKQLAGSSKLYNSTSNHKFMINFPELVSKNLKDIEDKKNSINNNNIINTNNTNSSNENKKNKNSSGINKELDKNELPASIDSIEDPEDRIRAEMLKEKKKKELERSNSLSSSSKSSDLSTSNTSSSSSSSTSLKLGANKNSNDENTDPSKFSLSKSPFMFIIVILAVLLGVGSRLLSTNN